MTNLQLVRDQAIWVSIEWNGPSQTTPIPKYTNLYFKD